MEQNSKIYILRSFGILGVGLVVIGLYVTEKALRDRFGRNDFGTDEKPVDSVALIKTHRCAGSALQNILFRRGLSHNLSFVVPVSGDYIGNPEYFSEQLVSPSEVGRNGYNILAYHTRYNGDAIHKVMKPDTKYITILRDPLTLFTSIYYTYKLDSLFEGKSLSEVLGQPKWREALKRTRMGQMIGANQMAFDLGFEWKEPASEEEIDAFIKKIDREFTLVLIFEKFYESLILLSETLHWSLMDVVVMDFNRGYAFEDHVLTKEEEEWLLEVNYIDVKLYKYFKEKFDLMITQYGIDHMYSKSYRLANLAYSVGTTCNSVIFGKPRSGVTKAKRLWCSPFVMNESGFTSIIRRKQGQNT